jgi:lipoprotein-releasing system ATP-binding protein
MTGTSPTNILRRFSRVFWPIFEFFSGGHIRKLLLPPEKKSKIGSKELENQLKLINGIGSREIVLRADRIKKRFSSPTPVEILHEVSLEVEKGQAIAIMGKSGEGKSTLLHILGTLEKQSSGELEICGKNAHLCCHDTLRNRHIGFIFQSYNLLEEYTVLDNVLMPARIARKNVSKAGPLYLRALELLEKVGLSARAHFLAKLLSGGEKQRTAIARALCNDPELILADEPSGNLDHQHSQEIHQLLIQLTRAHQKTLIVVTHDRELASLCDQVFILKDGKLNPDHSILAYPDLLST